jgi:hypothetical protein
MPSITPIEAVRRELADAIGLVARERGDQRRGDPGYR